MNEQEIKEDINKIYEKKYYALVAAYGSFYNDIIRSVIDHIEMWADDGAIKTTEDIVNKLDDMRSIGKMNCGIDGGIFNPVTNNLLGIKMVTKNQLKNRMYDQYLFKLSTHIGAAPAKQMLSELSDDIYEFFSLQINSHYIAREES